MILFADACARVNSRSRELAEAVLSQLSIGDHDVERVNLYEQDLKPLTEAVIQMRDEALKRSDFSDPYFDLAKQFSRADTIVMAAPYWDMSFPAVLKLYIENISVCGITFRYEENGMPHGLCRAYKLYYVTTAGGEIGSYNFGYDYIKALSLGLYGVKDASCIRVVGLDMDTVDADSVMENAKKHIAKMRD